MRARVIGDKYKELKYSAKKRGIEFAITKAEYLKLVEETRVCPVFGVPLTDIIGDFAPSLDRIDSTKGYTLDNVWIISWRSNRLKNNATLQELEMIVEAMRKKTNA